MYSLYDAIQRLKIQIWGGWMCQNNFNYYLRKNPEWWIRLWTVAKGVAMDIPQHMIMR